MAKIKAVIFDLDGTVTEPYLNFDQIREEIGLAQNAGPLLEEMDKMTIAQRQKAEQILHRHELAAVENSTLNKGAVKTFEKLAELNISVGILTRNTRKNAAGVAKKHNLKFDAVIDREDGPVKPHPFGVHKLCEYFNVTPAQVIVVGDYLFDLQSAKAAGAVAVLMKNSDSADKFASFADFTIESLTEIIDIINRN